MLIDFLIEIGFNQYDIALLIFCSFGAVIGSIAHAIVSTIDPDKPTTKDDEFTAGPTNKENEFFQI